MKTSAASTRSMRRNQDQHFPELSDEAVRFHIPPKNFPPREVYAPTGAQLAAEAAARKAGQPVFTPAFLTQMFGEPPIPLQRCFVTICSSLTAAVLLSVAVSKVQDIQSDLKQRRRKTTDGSIPPVDPAKIWFAFKSAEWLKETMLSRAEYQSAKKRLLDLDLLHERLEGVPATKEYHVNIGWLTQLMEDQANKKYAHRDFG
jgi:hypothetical protein